MNKHTAQDEFIGEVINVVEDLVEVRDESGKIHSFKIIGLDVPKEFRGFEGLKEFEALEMLEIGDKVRVDIKEGRLTSIQKVIGNNKR